ncbi:MAG: NAD(P)H-dependent oxidoreductase subunit E [Oscillospiraceae bacterium]|nr:NAD(P)H-dependent oxidoreductase subunit E [Oscillospiraceae bacterium]
MRFGGAVILDSNKLSELDSFIASLPGTEGELVTILHRAQSIFGYLPQELQLYISRRLGLPCAEVYGVVSFYSFFTMRRPGRHTVSVCMGTPCFVRGAAQILEAISQKLGIGPNETTPDGMFTLKDVRCVGACGLAPIVLVDGRVFGRVQVEEIEKILDQFRDEKGGIAQ